MFWAAVAMQDESPVRYHHAAYMIIDLGYDLIAVIVATWTIKCFTALGRALGTGIL